jgi:hypothetical protein
MRYGWLVVLVVVIFGCVMAGSCTEGPKGHYYPEGVLPTLTMDEINAAAGLQFENSKAEQLRRIAARPTLLRTEQVHLVNVSLRWLSFDSDRQAVVNDLIANPAFCAEAKSAILQEIKRFAFDATRAQVLKALNDKPMPGAVVPWRGE